MRTLKSATVIGALAVAMPALAEPSTATGDRAAQWVQRPSADEIAAVMPMTALRRGLGGSAIMECTVTVYGALDACRVVSETPAGVGFGEAAMSMAAQFVLRPAVHDGAPVASQMRIPIQFAPPAMETDTHLPGMRSLMAPRAVTHVPWTAAPSMADLAAAYPQRAREQHASGEATLDCHIDHEGRLGNCLTVREEPTGLGFAGAANHMVRHFRIAAEGPQGSRYADARTQIRFTFPAEILLSPHPMLARPPWAEQPSGDIPGSQYPAAAAAANIATGQADLDCVVTATGRLEACEANEQPSGYGFSDAALALSTGFRMVLWTQDGLPTVGATVHLPIRYVLPAPGATATASISAPPGPPAATLSPMVITPTSPDPRTTPPAAMQHGMQRPTDPQ